MITKQEYIEYANNGFNIVPLVKSIDANFDSPINLYSNIKNSASNHAFYYRTVMECY